MRYVLLFSIISFLQRPVFAQFARPAEQWQQDLTVLRTELPKRQPAVFTEPLKAKFEREIDALIRRLAGKSDLDVALAAQAAVARAGDSQTRIELQPLLQQQPVAPIGFGWYADGVFVSGTIQRFRAAMGQRVVAAGGWPIEEVMDRLQLLVPAENGGTVLRDGLLYLRFPAIWRALQLTTSDSLQLALEDPVTGKRQFLEVYAMDARRLVPEDAGPVSLPRRTPDLRWQPMANLYRTEWLPQDNIIYFQYNQCIGQEMALAAGQPELADRLPPFQPWADSLLALAERQPEARLFVDLRFNTGGWSADARALADRLAAMKRPGKIYVAVNLYTAMAAVEVADYFRETARATILGEAPAQRRYHTGDVLSFNLPNSRLEVRYSANYDPAVGGKNDDTLRPDVKIELPFRAFAEGKDPVLDYVRNVK